MSDEQRWTAQRSNSAFDDDQFYAMKGLRQIEVKTWEDAADLASTLNALEGRIANLEAQISSMGESMFDLSVATEALARKDALLRECLPYIKDYRNDTPIAAIDKEVE